MFLFIAALLGGALNSVAGGGSFLTLPALMVSGVSPVAANATSTLAMWPGAIASAVAYRREMTAAGRWLAVLGGVSLSGGLIGAVLLLRTSDTTFLRLLPWLMLMAAATFTFGNRLPRATYARAGAVVVLLQLAISIYGGYFGGGMGIMMLATMTLAGMTEIHGMNGLKSLLAVAINGVAIVAFAINGAIVWRPGLIMVAGSIAGGYAGASLARRIDQRWVRGFVILIGWTMTIYFFAR
ncbi:MAG: sulfite exporter TauE/SafE family protein [Acidobacteria bacterium]|nr:sulfite exporter TauE/SafE family protein [Acidobacteriota bacterium]